MNDLSVLITGGTGFVGRTVIQAVLARGRPVIATSTSQPVELPEDGRLEWVTWNSVTRPLPDVAWERIDTIIHLAQPRLVAHAAAAPLFAINVTSTFALLEKAREKRIPRVVLASSGDAIAPRGEIVMDTDCTHSTRTFYATTKACAELIGQSYGSNIAVAVVRIFHPWGPGGDRFLVNRLLRRVAAGDEIAIAGPSGILVNPIWIDDLAEGVTCAAMSDTRGVLHLGGPEYIRLSDLLERAGAMMGTRPRIRLVSGRPDDGHAGQLDRTLAQLSPWRPKVDVNQGLARIIAKWAKGDD